MYTSRRGVRNPSPPFRGERKGPTPQAWEGEVGGGDGSEIPHSPRPLRPQGRRGRCNRHRDRMKAPDTGTAARPRRLLFQKYFTALFVAVVVPLPANGASEAWFGYRDQREVLSQRLHAEARS